MAIDLHYDEPLLREVGRQYASAMFGWDGRLALLLTAVYVVWLLAAGEQTMFIGIVIGALGTAGMIAWFARRKVLSRGIAVFRMMKDPRATCEIEPDGLRMKSELGQTLVRWEMVRRLFRWENAWVLELTYGNYFTLPAADLDAASRAVIEERLRAAGCKVR